MRLTLTDPNLIARVQAHASARAVSVSAAAAELLASGLTLTQARRAGAHATNAGMTADERTTRARTAATARWADR